MPYTAAVPASTMATFLRTTPDNTSNYYTQDNFLTEGVFTLTTRPSSLRTSPSLRVRLRTDLHNLQLLVAANRLATLAPPSSPPNTTIAQGWYCLSWDVIATVDCTITNTGSVTACKWHNCRPHSWRPVVSTRHSARQERQVPLRHHQT